MNIDEKEYIGKEYYDKDYFETSGYKSGYDTKNLRRDSYLNKAIAVWITQVLGLGGKERILEIGCAFGWVIEQMVTQYGFDVYGQDISVHSIANVPPEIRHRVKECDSVEIAFNGDFDVIYSLETFEHIPKPLVDEYFRNMYDCLSDNGFLFCTICLGHDDNRGKDIDQSHQTLQPREWWNDKFKKAGFTIRKDLEAEAYELGLQTSEMTEGQWLPRQFNWHVFIAEKNGEQRNEKGTKIYDRRLMSFNNLKPTMVIVGSREASFEYPIADFFQIDNWGNYLSYFFNITYQGCENIHLINWKDFDLFMCALDFNVVKNLAANPPTCKSICFMDGTVSMISEKEQHRDLLFDLFDSISVICPQGAKVDELLDVWDIPYHRCGHIFPLRFFDSYFSKRDTKDFNILCAGKYNAESASTMLSVYIASKYSDNVFIGINNNSSAECCDNIIAYPFTNQANFYQNILSQVHLVIKADNPSGVGRIIAEAAAGGIPCIAGRDLFQIRCFPEIMVENYDDIAGFQYMIQKLKTDKDLYEFLSCIGRERLIASNVAEFNRMLGILNSLNFDVNKPQELYW